MDLEKGSLILRETLLASNDRGIERGTESKLQ